MTIEEFFKENENDIFVIYKLDCTKRVVIVYKNNNNFRTSSIVFSNINTKKEFKFFFKHKNNFIMFQASGLNHNYNSCAGLFFITVNFMEFYNLGLFRLETERSIMFNSFTFFIVKKDSDTKRTYSVPLCFFEKHEDLKSLKPFTKILIPSIIEGYEHIKNIDTKMNIYEEKRIREFKETVSYIKENNILTDEERLLLEVL